MLLQYMEEIWCAYSKHRSQSVPKANGPSFVILKCISLFHLGCLGRLCCSALNAESRTSLPFSRQKEGQEWPKHELGAGTRAGCWERHSVWLQEKLERSGSDEDLDQMRDGMAHTHHETDTSEVLRKSFESSLCCQQTAGILQEGIVQLELGQPDFPFHPLLCSA